MQLSLRSGWEKILTMLLYFQLPATSCLAVFDLFWDYFLCLSGIFSTLQRTVSTFNPFQMFIGRHLLVLLLSLETERQ